MEVPGVLAGRLNALGWAAFLACSWTWCIGMFLPVLLVRDFGFAGWVVFTIPNVIGAAAMGWVLQRPGAAAELSRRHWTAATAFSIVTILFHAFFVGWIVRALIGEAAEVLTVGVALAFYFGGRRGDRDLIAAVAVLAISFLAFFVVANLPDRTVPGPTGMLPASGLIWLAPVCAFGFLLCPYLDLTFLRARASTAPLIGIAAFTLGFGVLFLGVLLFTFWYARILQPGRLDLLPRPIAWILACYMIVQAAFTIALHTRAIGEDRRAKSRWVIDGFFAAIILSFLLGVAGSRFSFAGFSGGEIIYRLFMAFYGLIFPTYVWICMAPFRGKIGSHDRRALRIFAGAVLIAAPMFWLGFIANRFGWLAPAMAVVLLSRLLLYKHSPLPTAISIE